MSKKDDALKMALEALESAEQTLREQSNSLHPDFEPVVLVETGLAITAIREALAEQPAPQEWPKPKFVRNVDGVPCITLVEHEYLMRSRHRQRRTNEK